MPAQLLAERYEVEREVGSGGMACVYLARDTLLERRVALKVLDARHAGDPAYVERFRAEARAAARLQHPNVVGVIDRGEDGGREFIVYEYVEGESLKELVARDGPFTPERAARVGLDVARALAHAHEQGLVHRDVKPHNVLVGEDGRARVTDFGIARTLEGPDHTESGTILGTGSYVAPEQAQGERVGPPADVYSLGIVLYELLAGEPPFRGSSFVETAVRHVNEAPPDVRERRPDVPPRLAELVGRCLGKNPAERPTAAELAAELGAFARTPAAPPGAAVPADEDRTLVIARRPPAARRRRWPLALMAAVVVAAAVAGAAWVLRDDGDAGAAGTLVQVQASATYGPLGDGTENDGEASLATDGDPTTYWSTEGYDDFAATKEGVGLVLDTGGALVSSLTAQTSLPGWTAEIRTADDPAGPFERVVGEAQQVDAETTWELSDGSGRYLAIWITALAAEDGRDHARVDEVTARG
jgi:eukaryotic-like serine/threonine-protein kinase